MLLTTTNDRGDTTTSTSSSPSSPSGAAGHRSRAPPGGPEATRIPPGARKPAPHSAVAAGGPKLRATTAGNPRRRSVRRAAVSARSATIATRWAQPSSSTTVSRNLAACDPPIEQDNPGFRQPRRENKAGQSAPAPEIEDCGRAGEIGPGHQKTERVPDVVGERGRADRPTPLRRGEHREQFSVGRPRRPIHRARHLGSCVLGRAGRASFFGAVSLRPVRSPGPSSRRVG